ncbi:hemicentin-1-like, partial [Spinachia spinachia]
LYIFPSVGVLASGAVEVKPSINPAVVGDSVTLSLSPLTNVRSGSWAVGESLILTWLGDQQAVFPGHSGRASVNVLTGALALNSVRVADSGVYVLQSSDPELKAAASIAVFEPISNVTLRANQTELVELSGAAVFTCSVLSGSSLSFLWMNASSELKERDRVQLTDGNSTLTIVNVTRHDQGPFTCRASNAVSNGTSGRVNLTISYGPDNMALTVNGQNATSFLVGSNLTVLCSARSYPPAQLGWAFRGQLVNTTGPLLERFSVAEEHSGPYSCLAFNNHTHRNGKITAHIVIAKTSSRSEQQGIDVMLLPLLLMQAVKSTCLAKKTPTKKQPQSEMESLVFALILFTTTCYVAPAASTKQLYSSGNPVPVGSNVTLYSQANVKAAVWMFDTDIIVLMLSGTALITDNWTDRVILNPDFSLTISSLQQNDSGLYTLVVVNSYHALLTLSVQVPISNVTTWANATDLVEFNDTAVLKCSARFGSDMSYVWLEGGSEVTAGGRVQLSDGGATLSIVGVTRYDQAFSCNVSNGVSHEISLPLHLNISYGPSDTSMVVTPMRPNYVVGSDITLSCSADSSPPATIRWMVDGVHLNRSGPQLQLEMVTESQSGNYQCIFYNTVTSRFSSQSSFIEILDPQKYIHVETPINPAKEGDIYELTCNISAAATQVHWLKNGVPLHEDNTTVFNLDNRTVTFNPLRRNHTGYYKCMATTALWILTCRQHMLVVNYGPETPVVEGPAFAQTGQSAAFNCSAASMPPSQFSWWFNGSGVSNSSVFTADILSTNMSGEITCKAYNLVTEKYVTKSMMLTAIEPIQSVVIRNNTVPINSANLTLTCDVTGPYNEIHWMKDNMPLSMTPSAVNPHISYHIENDTLQFTPLTLYHDGTYQCVATNLAGHHKSAEYNLLVNYGPWNVKISGQDSTKPHLTVSLTCSADSRPDCNFYWFFNQSSAALHTGSVYTFLGTKATEGNYTCKATNPVTNITVSQTTAVSVEEIESVVIRNNTVPINSANLTLTCDVTGPYDEIHWMKDNMPLSMTPSAVNPHISYHIENDTLQFTPLTLYHDGTYQCVATNLAGHHKSAEYNLLVNYGPLNVKISNSTNHGPLVPFVPLVSLTCSADSWPQCDFNWLFNGRLSEALKAGSTITFPATTANQGNYTCKATNAVTNITVSQTTAYSVAAFSFPSQAVVTMMGLFALSVPVLFH